MFALDVCKETHYQNFVLLLIDQPGKFREILFTTTARYYSVIFYGRSLIENLMKSGEYPVHVLRQTRYEDALVGKPRNLKGSMIPVFVRLFNLCKRVCMNWHTNRWHLT